MPENMNEAMSATETTSSTSPKKPKSKTPSIIATIVVAIGIVGGIIAWQQGMFSSDTEMDKDTITSDDPNEQAAARINDVEIMVKDVQTQANALIAASGITDITPELQQQALQESLQILINQEILFQTATKAGLIADVADIDTGIDSIKTRFASEAEYQAALARDGLTEQVLRDSLNRQIVIEAYVESVIDQDSLTPSEEDVQALYDQYAALQDNMPEIDEIYSQLEAELEQQRINAQLGLIIDQLLEEADFEIL